jgi:hypothetical protein
MPWVKSLTRFDQPKPTSKKQSWWAKMWLYVMINLIIKCNNKTWKWKACRTKKIIIITKMWIKMAFTVMIIFSSCDKKRVLMNTNR